MEYDWIIWMIGGLCVTFTVIGGLMCVAPDQETKDAGQKILAGWWGAVATIAAATAFMHFIGKPVLNWLFNLVF